LADPFNPCYSSYNNDAFKAKAYYLFGLEKRLLESGDQSFAKPDM